jgi:hypothetical protein
MFGPGLSLIYLLIEIPTFEIRFTNSDFCNKYVIYILLLLLLLLKIIFNFNFFLIGK